MFCAYVKTMKALEYMALSQCSFFFGEVIITLFFSGRLQLPLSYACSSPLNVAFVHSQLRP